MSDSDGDDRPFDPTPRRRQRARDEGDVPRSSALVSATGWLAGLAVLRYSGPAVSLRVAEWSAGHWKSIEAGPVDRAALVSQLQQIPWLLVAWCAPVLLAIVVAILAIHVLQFGWLWLPDRLVPRFDRFGPGAAWRQWGTGESWRSAWRDALQLAAGLAVIGWMAWSRGPQLVATAVEGNRGLPRGLFEFVVDTGLRAGTAWLSVGLADYAWAWRRLELRLRLTYEEAREEVREEARSRRISAEPTSDLTSA